MANYPSTIVSFGTRIDNQSTVMAFDVNSVYSEVEEIERQLGAGGVTAHPSWSNYSAATSSSTDWYSSGGLKARLQNIEAAIYQGTLIQAIDGGTP